MIIRTQENKQTTAYSERKAKVTTWHAPDAKLVVVKTKCSKPRKKLELRVV
jgi:hypothetical protein